MMEEYRLKTMRTTRPKPPVTGLWARLLLGHQRDSVGIINGERGSVEEGVDIGREIGV